MINHVRTLLMNRKRNGHGLDTFGEEYIPAEFVPKKLNVALSLAHRTLFGGKPDRVYVNYRMRQIMELMHATPLAVDIVDKDPRITYLPFKQDLFADAFKIEVTRISGPARVVHVAGTHTTNFSSGIVQQLWDVEVTDSGQARVWKRREPFADNSYAFDDKTPVPLAGSELKLYLHDAPVGYRLQIQSNARPTLDISELLRQLSTAFGERGLQEVFPPIAPEPVATWARIWNESHLSAMRFTALLLAIAHRIEQMPQEVT